MFGPRIKTISTDELAERLAAGKPLVLDVREGFEFAAGHVPRAVNIPLGRLKERMGNLDKNATTYVICASGHRSATAARKLMRAGFTDVYSVAGGTGAWRGKLKK